MFSLKSLVPLLRAKGLLVDVAAPVDPFLELAEIHRRVLAEGGPAILFHRVIGSPFPVLTNLFGTKERVDFLFSQVPDDLISNALSLLTAFPSLSSLWKQRALISRCLSVGLRRSRKFPLKPMPVDLYKLPMLTSWPEDGGAFLTLPLVYTESPITHAPNLGMYRMQRHNQSTLGLHFQIQKGGGTHFHEAEQLRRHLPVTVFLSGNPFLILSAIAPLPENLSELLFCSFLQGKRIPYRKDPITPHPLLIESEFILIGEAIAGKRQPEGPFGDHFGYYSLKHNFPIFACRKLYCRKDAIYPATVVGKPCQEDFFLGEKLQSYLSPLFPYVMPGVTSLKSYGEAGFHALTTAVVNERYWKESLRISLRILGEGQLSLTKFLMVTDQPVNLNCFSAFLEILLARIVPRRDLIIFPDTANDTLDYTGPKLNQGSKALFIGVGNALRELPAKYTGPLLPQIDEIGVFCPGCLVLQTSKPDIARLLKTPNLVSWPLIVLTDDLQTSLASQKDFLWRTFTRAAPATDLHINQASHGPLECHFPMILNALMKPSYPKEVEADPCTKQKVSVRWKEYFQGTFGFIH